MNVAAGWLFLLPAQVMRLLQLLVQFTRSPPKLKLALLFSVGAASHHFLHLLNLSL